MCQICQGLLAPRTHFQHLSVSCITHFKGSPFVSDQWSLKYSLYKRAPLSPKAISLCPRVSGFVAFFKFCKFAHAWLLLHDSVPRKWPTHNSAELINLILSMFFFSFHTSTQGFQWPSSSMIRWFFFFLSARKAGWGESWGISALIQNSSVTPNITK